MMKWKPVTAIKDLQPGMHIRSRFNGEVYIVWANYGGRVTAVQAADVTNPPEWEVLGEIECICDGGEQGDGLCAIPHEPHCPLAEVER